MRNTLYKILFVVAGIFFSGLAIAQKDTVGKGGIDIVSSFKPVLRQTAKINFSASPAPVDTTKAKLNYDIPNQNLLFAYQPGSLKPLALGIDTGGNFDNSSYVKAGFGSLRTPFVQAGISLGDGKTAGLNIFARHVSSDGKRDYQQFTNTRVRLTGFFKSGNNLEWNAGIGFQQDKTYKYGYEPQTLIFSPDSLRQNFQTIAGRLAFHNINKTAFGLTYSPEVKIDVFSDNHDNSELYKTSNFNIEAGIRPSWDNGTFKMFPNILAAISTSDSRITFQAGWTGYVRKTTYQYLASQNPWLWIPENFTNTWIEERFGGFKGSVGDHFTYAAKVAFNKINNQPLFVNDTTTGLGGKSFRVVNERRINVVNFGGEVGVNFQERFSLTAGLQFNQFTGLRDNAKAWGLLPLEFKTAMRLQIIKDLWLKGDLFAWGGPDYRKKDGSAGKLDGAVDLNAGLEFKITKNLNLWTQFNNLFNKQYQRWNQYPVYGFNFVGGIVFSFDQKN